MAGTFRVGLLGYGTVGSAFASLLADSAAGVEHQHPSGTTRRRDAELLGDPVQEPARQPQLVGDVGRRNRADLELPLRRHDLGVRSVEVDARAHAGVGVRFHDVAAENLIGADAAVVAALRRGEAVVGPAERPRALEERVLLLDAEPRVVIGVLLGYLP